MDKVLGRPDFLRKFSLLACFTLFLISLAGCGRTPPPPYTTPYQIAISALPTLTLTSTSTTFISITQTNPPYPPFYPPNTPGPVVYPPPVTKIPVTPTPWAYPPPSPSPAGTRTPTPTSYPVLMLTSPVEVIYPRFQIVDISFVDDTHGWALGQYSTGTPDIHPAAVLRVTYDGGVTWMGSGIVPGVEAHLRFANRKDGWAFGPDLYATHDGGQTWQAETMPAPVNWLEPAGGTVWAITALCNDQSCTYQLLEASAGGGAWKAVAVQPPEYGPLIRSGRDDAWMMTVNGITLTRDGGKTWKEHTGPIPGADGFLVLYNNGHLTLLLLYGGMQVIYGVFRSTDGGVHWIKIEGFSPDWMGSGGAQIQVASFSAASDQHAFLVLHTGAGGDRFAATFDGGSTWEFPIQFDSVVMGFMSTVLFEDDLHGWTEAGNMVFRTTDGGVHWTVAVIQ